MTSTEHQASKYFLSIEQYPRERQNNEKFPDLLIPKSVFPLILRCILNILGCYGTTQTNVIFCKQKHLITRGLRVYRNKIKIQTSDALHELA